MAGFLRQNILTPYILTLFLWLLLLLAHVNDVCASPIARELLLRHDADLVTHLWKRTTPIVVSSEVGDNTTVLDPGTNEAIPQGPGTDGAGAGFSLTAILWLVFVFVVGIPLALAGVRLWRFTTGMAVGLALTVCVWTAFVNTVSSDGLSDILLTVIALGGFAVGFVVGMLKFGRWAGVLLLGILGGFSVGLRIVLLRPGLLVPDYRLNWLVLTVFFVMGVVLVLVWQHFGISASCAAIGTFLIGLGIDLIMEKQNGMSFALRFFFDRNNSHFLAIVYKGYNPSLMTQIVLGASIGAIHSRTQTELTKYFPRSPILGFAQHRIFKGPFHPESSTSDAELSSLAEEPEPGLAAEKLRMPRMQLIKSRFSFT
ncbi:hypothetical protein LXA43DRAFT_1061562 [Ganoderma leucocontextum]|nr:hypothetical protein LXA43DRAFT_1061562 [Ganoderma leucocontextum]